MNDSSQVPAEDDKILLNVKTIIQDTDVRELAKTLSTELSNRLGYIFTPVECKYLHQNRYTLSEDEKRNLEKSDEHYFFICLACSILTNAI